MAQLKNLFSYFNQHKKIIFLLLTVLSGIYILFPLHDFQPAIATGDHGRELYSYQKTMEGAVPYQDFSWLYGPLLLYYYSMFFKLFGVTIQTVLLGQNLLILGVGVVIFLIASAFMSPALAYIGALTYWVHRGAEFFFSYHHVGGVLVLLTILYFVFRYIQNPHMKYVYCGFIGSLLLILIRLNMGIAILVAYVSSLLIIDFVRKDAQAKKKFALYVMLSLWNVVIAATVYWYLIHPLPKYAFLQTFPYSHAKLAAIKMSPLDAAILFSRMLVDHFSLNWYRVLFGLTIILSMIQLSVLIIRKSLAKNLTNQIFLIFSSLLIFLFLGMHEFIGSGVPFRLNWVIPVLIIIMLYFIHFLMDVGPEKIFTPLVKFFIILVFLYFPLSTVSRYHAYINAAKTPDKLLHVGKNKIYTHQHPFWIKTVTDAANYIKQHVPENEKIFAIPHDSLYYFLSERDGASRQLALFEHTYITPEQEHKIISDLEKHNVQWVIVSSRVRSVEFGMGVFGVTHCKILADYLNNHFEGNAQLGDWDNPGGWAANHGVRILKKKNSL